MVQYRPLVPTLSFHEGRVQGLWSKERSQVCGLSSLGPLPLSASVSLCGPVVYYVRGRVYEVLGFCSSKTVFLPKLVDPFLAPGWVSRVMERLLLKCPGAAGQWVGLLRVSNLLCVHFNPNPDSSGLYWSIQGPKETLGKEGERCEDRGS